MFPKIASTTALIAALVAVQAQAATVHRIEPVSASGFDVVAPGLPDRAAFWCAAGRYVTDTLRQSGRTQIMLVEVEGRREIIPDTIRARFVVNPRRYGLLPIGAGANMHVLVAGDHMPAALARAMCRERGS